MTQSIFAQAINITIIGMLVVFVFLTLLVGMMKLLAKLVAVLEVYFPQPTPKTAAAAATANHAVIALAIAAAKRFQHNKGE